MARWQTRINPGSPDFQHNREHMQHLTRELQTLLEQIRRGGGEQAQQRHVSRGKLLPRERIDALLDTGSPFLELSPLAAWQVYDEEVPARSEEHTSELQ